MKRKSKKLVALLMACTMLFSMAGCGKEKTSDEKSTAPKGTTSAVEKTEEAQSTTQEPTQEPSTNADTPSITAVEYYGQLNAKGNQIVGAKTDEVAQVAGMSFFWSDWSKRFYTKEFVAKVVDEMNCEVVRAAYGVDDSGKPHSKTNLELVRTLIEGAIEKGVYIIIDWHSHGAHKNPEEAKEFFVTLAKEYGEYDNVIFELYNEPTSVKWSQVKEYAEELIPEIRKYSDNLILVGSPTWSQDVDVASKDPVEGDNIGYVLHFYAGTHKEGLRSKAETALKNGIALFVTEWGSVNADGNGGINYESTTEWINWMNKHKLSWCNWAVNDKNETSSIFTTSNDYTETGNFLKALITDSSTDNEWRTGTPKTHEELSYDPADFGVVETPREIKTHDIAGKFEAVDYSTMKGIQTEACDEGGSNVGYIEANDWIQYSVDVKEAGDYAVTIRIASEKGGGEIAIEAGDAQLGSIEIPKTGSWQTWEDITLDITLEAGKQELKINAQKGGFNLKTFDFVAK